jgi:hypothetical protein
VATLGSFTISDPTCSRSSDSATLLYRYSGSAAAQ